MQLSSEQQIAFDKFQQGKNLFITGPGGSGKSALVKLFYGTEPNIQITALTGCAAILLGCQAKTIHSWAGIGLGTDSIENIILKIKRNPHKRSQWRDIKTLVIDEISMMSQKLFELINEIGKHFKKNTRPFGGIQIIALGDFYQLPPVSKDEEVSFCFESPVWRETFSLDCHIKLIHIFRQSDETYATILNQIREGKIKKKSYNIFNFMFRIVINGVKHRKFTIYWVHHIDYLFRSFIYNL